VRERATGSLGEKVSRGAPEAGQHLGAYVFLDVPVLPGGDHLCGRPAVARRPTVELAA